MLGALIIVVALLVVIPVGVLASTPILAAIFGQTLTADGEARNEGSELIPLNK
ncbi:MAG: hypothetical protein R2704_10740 [Microthrixaceae bacterium]